MSVHAISRCCATRPAICVNDVLEGNAATETGLAIASSMKDWRNSFSNWAGVRLFWRSTAS